MGLLLMEPAPRERTARLDHQNRLTGSVQEVRPELVTEQPPALRHA